MKPDGLVPGHGESIRGSLYLVTPEKLLAAPLSGNLQMIPEIPDWKKSLHGMDPGPDL